MGRKDEKIYNESEDVFRWFCLAMIPAIVLMFAIAFMYGGFSC